MAKYEEVELKLYVPDLETVRERLELAGAILTKPRVYERNVRYDDAKGSLRAGSVVLRLREDTRVRLTYKEGGEVSERDVLSRYEAEVEVSDFETMETILGKLGYHPYMVYEKYRTTYELDEVEIVLDEMPFGSFVELEGESAAIERVRERLGLADAPTFRAGYGVLFDRVRDHLGLRFDDLTFENFKGIRVPPAAFEG